MRLTVRILGLELLHIDATTTDTEDDTLNAPFGFSGSGTGIIELCADTALDTLDI